VVTGAVIALLASTISPAATSPRTMPQLSGVADYTGDESIISNTADSLPTSETLGATGDMITRPMT
jgi:hypothetical protein